MKTSELIGPALDWAVAKCEGIELHHYRFDGELKLNDSYAPEDATTWSPSTNWSQGGPIIEWEKITVAPTDGKSFIGQAPWSAYRIATLFEEGFDHEHQHGPTPLIAAMRCFVASKLGDEIDIPKELQ